jgi:amino acid transporter
MCSVYTVIIGSCLAEICSVYPNAGSVYYWAGMLASEKRAGLAAFITGYFNLLGNAAG